MSILSDELEMKFKRAGIDSEAMQDRAMRRAGAAFREGVEAEAVGGISDRELGRALFIAYLMGVREASIFINRGSEAEVNG